VPTETAFAKQVDGSTCFLDIAKKKGMFRTSEADKFDRWGWTNMCEANEGSYVQTLPMYAGAAQCDICLGAFVVNVTIDYLNGLLTVGYSVFDGFFLNEVHIHVDGQEKVPFDGGSYTVDAPGQYGCGTHTDDSCTFSVNTDYVFEATFTDVPATTFYVIAHAVVAGSSLAFSNNKGCD
jgi:hypothetical protein